MLPHPGEHEMRHTEAGRETQDTFSLEFLLPAQQHIIRQRLHNLAASLRGGKKLIQASTTPPFPR